jgi:1-phosphofructokinase family hexose kinase
VILCVAANPSVDRLLSVERLAPGSIHRPFQAMQVAGGKGLNVARSAQTLGGRVRAAALLGGHAGRWVAEDLERCGVPLEAAWTSQETRSSFSVSGDPSGLTEFYEAGGPISEAEWDAFAALVEELAPAADWVSYSGSLPPGAPGDGYVRLIPLSRAAFDSAEAGVEARPGLVKVNAEEAARLTGRAVSGRDGALVAARLLHQATGGAAIVTFGREGAVMLTSDGRSSHGRAATAGPYPVGSGDAFLAGVLVALEQGSGWDDALRLGLGAAAANAEEPGAGRFDRDRAEQLATSAITEELT